MVVQTAKIAMIEGEAAERIEALSAADREAVRAQALKILAGVL